jgi:hypothetical protein
MTKPYCYHVGSGEDRKAADHDNCYYEKAIKQDHAGTYKALA